MSARAWGEVRDVNAMVSLLFLALIGAGSGGAGGALTNGIDGFILGSCAGFVLGVVVWITEGMTGQRPQEIRVDQVGNEFDQSAAPVYDQATARPRPQEQRPRS